MSGPSTIRSAQRPRALVSKMLRAGCEASFTVNVALLAASLASIALGPGPVLRALRTAMIEIGIPLLVLSMAVAALASHRIARDVDVRALHRLRERLYFVAALVLTVLVPSVLLGARVVLAPRPGGLLAVHAVEAGAWLVAAWLQWGNVRDARTLALDGERDQPEDERRASDRSISSMR